MRDDRGIRRWCEAAERQAWVGRQHLGEDSGVSAPAHQMAVAEAQELAGAAENARGAWMLAASSVPFGLTERMRLYFHESYVGAAAAICSSAEAGTTSRLAPVD
jgi:uncharacterized protein (DUF1800 family)